MRSLPLLPLLLASLSTLGAAQTPPGTAAGSGTAWLLQDSHSSAGLRGIVAVDDRVAWASGTGGTVLRTADGGEHWTACAIPEPETGGGTLDFRGVQASDATTAIVMGAGPGEKSRLYQTIDGCKTWFLAYKNPDAPDGFFDTFRVFWRTHAVDQPFGFGLLLGDPVMNRYSLAEAKTGIRWRAIPHYFLPAAEPGEALFAASNSNFAILRSGRDTFEVGFVTGGKPGPRLVRLRFHAVHGDTHLGDVPPPTPLPLASGAESAGAFSIAARDVSGLSFVPAHTYVVVGGDYAKPGQSEGTAAWSTDGGKTWTAALSPPHGYRSAVQWWEAAKAWIAVGPNGSDYSRDDGKTWQLLDDGNWNALALPFVVGPQGRIARLNPTALPPPPPPLPLP